jgi:hypothetical protein
LGDLIQTVAMAAGLSWASGFRLYAVLFTVGLLAKFGVISMPAALSVLSHPWVLGASGVMLVAEFVADKVPVFDSLWDSFHTFIRIPAGAVLAAAAIGQADPVWVAIAGIPGGTLAGTSHFTKAGSRAVINTSPEPFTNWATSFGEEALVAGGLFTALFHPLVFLVGLVFFILIALWLIPKIWRGIRRVLSFFFSRGAESRV